MSKPKCYGCGHHHGPKVGARDCPKCDCLGFIFSEKQAPAVLGAFLSSQGHRVSSSAPSKRRPKPAPPARKRRRAAPRRWRTILG